MKSSFYRRENAAFFSYSSRDDALASGVVGWLKDCAKLKVWYDAKDMTAGRSTALALEEAVGVCRAYVLLATPHSLDSKWVDLERQVAAQQSAEYKGFKVIAVVTSDVSNDDIPASLQGITRIQLPGQVLDGRTAAKLLSSLRPEPVAKQSEDDVFVTRTWQEDEPASKFADVACRKLAEQGFRLIGDEPRRADERPERPVIDDEQRLRNIISSCAAYLALIPPRAPAELKWLLKDLNVAKSCGLPVVILADPKSIAQAAQGQLTTDTGEAVNFDGAVAVIEADMAGGTLDEAGRGAISKAVSRIGEAGRSRPQNPYSVFYAAPPGQLSPAERGDIDRIVGSITGRRCIYPDDIDGAGAYERTVGHIADSVLTIADVGGDGSDGWVYAAVASGARRLVQFVTAEAELRKPALFSNFTPRIYATHVERLGHLHAALYEHRRLFLDREVTR